MDVIAHDSLALRIERDRADRRPVARPTGPARRMSLAGLEIRLMACSQDRRVLKRVSLRRGDVADAAVAVLEVVPAHEVASPGARGPAKLKLEEVLASQSKKTLDAAFQRVSGDLSGALKKLEAEKARADGQVKKFEDPDRLTAVRQYFSSQVLSLSNLVDVPIDEQIGDPKPGARAQSGGSSAPRSMLAVHLAMLATNAEWGDSPLFPFVVDTPQQSGQDDPNLTKMVEVLGRAAGVHHQVILAAERLPASTQLGDFDAVRLTQKRTVLSKDVFDEAVERLQGPLMALRESQRPAVETA